MTPAEAKLTRTLTPRDAAGVGLVALLVRLVYLFQVRHTPLYLGLGLDAKFYHRWAQEIAAGHWWGGEPFFMGPLYSYFLAVVYALTGADPFHARLVQALVGAVTVVLVALLGSEVAGRRGGIAAGLLAAFYGPLILYDAEILFPVLQVPLVAVSLLLLLQGARRGARWRWLASGVALGLAAVGNASVLVFAPVAAAWAWWMGRRAPRHAARASAGRLAALLVLAGAALVILPVTVRNWAVGQDFVLITSNGGLNLYIGNSEEASGAYIKPEGLDVENDPAGTKLAEHALGRRLRPSQVSAWWGDRAREFMRSHPGRTAALYLKKLTLFWGSYEVPQIENFLFQRRYSGLLRLPFPLFGSLLALAVAGAIALRPRWGETAPLLLFPLVHSLVISVFFVVGRYRVAVVPALAALAAAGFFALADDIRARRARRAGLLALAGLAVFAASLANPFHVRRDSGFAQCHYRQGVELQQAGRASEAEAEFDRSIALDPTYAPAHLNRGILLAERAEPAAAEAAFAEALRLDPDYASAHYDLGTLLESQGRLAEAALSYERALAMAPDRADARLALGRVAYRGGDLDRARAAFTALAGSDHGSPSAPGEPPGPRERAAYFLDLLGRREGLARELGDARDPAWLALLAADATWAELGPAAASPAYRAVADGTGPALARAAAAYELGAIAYAARDLATARREFERAIELRSDLPLVHFALGNTLFLLGDARGAVAQFQRELARDPRHAPSWLNLGGCYESALGDVPRAIEAYSRYVELGGERAAEIRARLEALSARR